MARDDSKFRRHPGRCHEERELTRSLTLLAVAILGGQVSIAVAQGYGGDLAVTLNSRTLAVQAKADELFEREDYQRAHVIYLKDLAPIGDKYAQYMLGFMSLGGLGVERDPVLASVWYRLAAERGEPVEFVAIRDELLGQLSATDRLRSDEILFELRQEYGDMAICVREVRDAFQDLAGVTTGSRIGSNLSSAVTIVEPGSGSIISAEERRRRDLRRMQKYLDYITANLGMERIAAEDVNAARMSELEARVDEYLRRPPDDR